MKRLTALSVPLLTLAIAGCGEESDQLPVDGREFDGVNYSEPAPYQGRVIDGYLKNARVWLDIDGDGQYTPGPLQVILPSGIPHTLENGEPTALTEAGGRFELDVSGLEVDPQAGANLDPRAYSLYAVAIPGKTLEETRSGEVPVARAYLMSASPGVQNVTPLTTLARYRAEVAKRTSLAPEKVTPESYAGLEGLSLLQDYILAGDERAHAYARAMARFMASQIPDDYNTALSAAGSDGTERFLSTDAVELLGLSLVQNAPAIIGAVEGKVSAGNYSNLDPDSLELPDVPLELSNPVLLTRQQVFADAGSRDLGISAELFFDYTEGGQLSSISARGCLAPSLTEIARLVQVNGYMAELKTQWLPGASLSELSKVFYDEDGIHERIIFDWKNKQAYFDSVTSCHQGTLGVAPEISELDGTPEITWGWEDGNAVVERVVGEPDRTVTLLAANSPADVLVAEASDATLASGAASGSQITGYRIESGGEVVAEIAFSAPEAECEPKATDRVPLAPANQYVTRLFELEPTDGAGAYEYDIRDYQGLAVERLLRYPVYDPATAALENVDSDTGLFQWQLYYPGLDTEGLSEVAANLIEHAYLVDDTGAEVCGEPFPEAPSNAYARVDYGYQALSEYLLEGLSSEVAPE